MVKRSGRQQIMSAPALAFALNACTPAIAKQWQVVKKTHDDPQLFALGIALNG